MYCVIDSSFTASLFLPDEQSERSDKVAERLAKDGATAPALWQFEIANLLLMAVRRKRLTAAHRSKILAGMDALPIVLQSVLTPKQRDAVMHPAEKHSLTAYDAAYLELAIRVGLPLATLDASLSRAAKLEGVEVVP